jgi:sulfite exporter TauE/SafE
MASSPSTKVPLAANDPGWLVRWLIMACCLAGILLLFYLDGLLHQHPVFSLDGENLNYGLLFLTGLFTGFHCVGMCGALVVGYSLRGGGQHPADWRSHLQYALGKTVSYTAIGALFGALGAIITFTPWLRGVVGLLAGGFLLVFGLSVINPAGSLHRLRFRTPGFLMRFIGQAYRRYSHPLIIGLLNGLMIICGPLQALYIMAAGTGNPLSGAKLLLAFGLGTLPVMMGFGFLTSGVSNRLAPRIVKASGFLVVALGLIMLNRGLIMTGSGWDFLSLKNRLLSEPVATEPVGEHHHGAARQDLPAWARQLNDEIALWLEQWRTHDRTVTNPDPSK